MQTIESGYLFENEAKFLIRMPVQEIPTVRSTAYIIAQKPGN